MSKQMNIETRDFGEISISEEDTISFISGIYGFDDYKKYIILKDSPEDDIMFLQSLDNMELSFVLIDPYAVFIDYNPTLNEDDLYELNSTGTELKFLVIAIIKENIKESVVNLKSPIAINPKNRTAKQVILQNEYPLRYNIVSAEEGNKC
ncbi:MAG: flagellar assembly protein FliW [Tissierellia bacterium]|nr:flagellar assembly protein FliW [Tissierellia bacterium]MDD4437024.1 flagellar assembly protein FliW [Tissierellia bacterium]